MSELSFTQSELAEISDAITEVINRLMASGDLTNTRESSAR